MYLFNDLRAERFITEKKVPCPVRGCPVQVERQAGKYQKLHCQSALTLFALGLKNENHP